MSCLLALGSTQPTLYSSELQCWLEGNTLVATKPSSGGRRVRVCRQHPPATVRDILCATDLQPHRFRYWKTTIWDDEAVERALKILWYYERIERLWQREVIICTDEKPNIQVLERAMPTQPMQPGQIERQEFEYKRHGTVNLLVGLIGYNGRMSAECLDKNDGEHFRPRCVPVAASAWLSQAYPLDYRQWLQSHQ